MPEQETEKTFDEIFDEVTDETKSTEELLKQDADKQAEDKSKEADAGRETDKDQLTEEEAKAMMDSSTESTESTEQTGQEQSATGGTEPTELLAKVAQLEDELKKERQKTGSWDGRIRAANDKVKLLEEENTVLKAQVEKSESASTDEKKQSREEIMSNFKETFPELVDYMDIVKADIAKQIPKPTAKAEPEVVVEETKPVVPEFDSKKHFNEINEVHPDLGEAVSSGVLQTWINKQGPSIQPHLQTIFDGGTATQVINLMTNFKIKTGWVSQLDPGAGKQNKLQSMIAAEGESPGPKSEGPDKNDFKAAAKEIGL